MNEDQKQRIIDMNYRAFEAEAELSLTIRQRNRHSSQPPFQWFGPDPEPTKGDCRCVVCDKEQIFYYHEGKVWMAGRFEAHEAARAEGYPDDIYFYANALDLI